MYKKYILFILLVSSLFLAGCDSSKTTNTSVEKKEEPQRVEPIAFDSPRGVFYEIYVNSFYDSDGDGHGDLKGLTEKLDYLNDGNQDTKSDLGVDGIWLMPINVSPSYHKYDVTDYKQIDPEYGSTEDFKALLDAAHKRGMKVLMDFVSNHTSIEHPWFKKGSRDSESEYHDYYVWADKDTDLKERGKDGQQLWYKNPNGEGYYYSTFSQGMPDLNYANPEVRKNMIARGKYWLNMGVDGFRLDGAMYIYPGWTEDGAKKNIKWWHHFQNEMAKVNPDVYLIGEVWDRMDVIAPYYKSLNSAFDFPLAETLVASVTAGFDKGIAKMAEADEAAIHQVNETAVNAPFLSNHDQNRIMGQFLGDMDKAKSAARLLLTMPGNPFIYYGEELGMQGSKPDEQIRSPLPWYENGGNGQTTWEELPQEKGISVESETGDKNSLLNTYRQWIRIRHRYDALMTGNIKALDAGDSHIVAFIRESDKEKLIVLHNLSGENVTADFPEADGAEIVESTGKSSSISGTEVIVPAMGSVILKVK